MENMFWLYKTTTDQCSVHETRLEKDYSVPLCAGSGNGKDGLGKYHYGEMIDRLNGIEEKFKIEKIFEKYSFDEYNQEECCKLGNLLRRVWRKYEWNDKKKEGLIVIDRKVCFGMHETKIDDFEGMKTILENIEEQIGLYFYDKVGLEVGNEKVDKMIKKTFENISENDIEGGIKKGLAAIGMSSHTDDILKFDEIKNLLKQKEKYSKMDKDYKWEHFIKEIKYENEKNKFTNKKWDEQKLKKRDDKEFRFYGYKFSDKKKGIYTDLVNDTYLRKWTRAYQMTFHELFHNIDFLAGRGEYFSLKYKYSPSKNEIVRNFLDVIINDIANLFNKVKYGQEKESRLYELNEKTPYEKAFLYDLIGGWLIFREKPCKKSASEECKYYSPDPDDCDLKNDCTLENCDITKDSCEFRKTAKEYCKNECEKGYYGCHKCVRDGKEIGCTKMCRGFCDNPHEDLNYTNKYITGDYMKKFGFGHNVKYWDNEKKLACETFANMAAAAIVNPVAFVLMKQYLSGTYNVFMQILIKMAST